jgi:hypothetical protein
MRRGLFALLVACTPADAPPTAPPPAPALPAPPPATSPPAPATPASLPAPAAHAEFIARAIPLRCAWELRCGVIGSSQRERCLRDGEALRDRLLGVDRGLAAGRYHFDPERAAACLRLLAGASCQPDYAAAIADCLSGAVPGDLRPAVAPGGACERWEECVGGRCTGELGCPGTCVAHQPDTGAPCGPEQLCADGLYCARDTCQPRGDVGATCRGHWQACAPGLVCQGWTPAVEDRHHHAPERPGTCEPPRGVGQPCRRLALGDDCEPDLFCDFADERPTCRARLPEGTACPWLEACADGLACDGILLAAHAASNGSGVRAVQTPGVCRPHGDHGSACDPLAAATVCPSDTRCTPAGTCARRGGDGDACRESQDCLAYHWCDPQRRVCVAQGQPGDRCQPGGTEQDGPCFLAECVRGRCKARCDRGQ